MNAILFALALAASPQQNFDKDAFIKKFDEAGLISSSFDVLIEEAYENGFGGVKGVFTPGEPVGELKESFGNGFKQIRLSSNLDFNVFRNYLSFNKVSRDIVVREYGKTHYNKTTPELIEGIRSYTEDTSASAVIEINFKGPLRKISSWFVFVKINKDKKWRIDFASPFFPAPASAGAFLYPR